LIKYIIYRHDGAPLLNIVQSLELCGARKNHQEKSLLALKFFVDELLVFQASPVVLLTCAFGNMMGFYLSLD